MAFPVLTNVWPLLLFVSQKAFVLPGLVLVGAGDAPYRRDVSIIIGAMILALLVYANQYANTYDQAHLVGFLLFALSVPLINLAVRSDSVQLRRWLTYFTLFNALMGVVLLVTNVDLYNFRGLNKVEDSAGVTNRVYFESSSLAAVFLISTFRQRWLKILTVATVFVFVVLLARSVVIIALLGLNFAYPYFVRSSPLAKVLVVIFSLIAVTAVYIYLPVIRPDVDLSLRAKQFQLDLIGSMLNNSWSALGWGAYLPQLATDVEQPYQVEMQLPMLLLQLGVPTAFGIIALMLAAFLSASSSGARALARFFIYALVGFNNPWLFVPSWFLTCQLLFRDEHRESK